jgi:hypothetical protein
MRLMTVALMACVLLTLPASAQGMRGRFGTAASTFAAGNGSCPRGNGTCGGAGPKRQGHGGGKGSCQRGMRAALRR